MAAKKRRSIRTILRAEVVHIQAYTAKNTTSNLRIARNLYGSGMKYQFLGAETYFPGH
jgi:hypothetical protein